MTLFGRWQSTWHSGEENMDEINSDLVSVLLGAYQSTRVKLPRKRLKADWFASQLKISSRAATVPAALDILRKRTDPGWWDFDPVVVSMLDENHREEVMRRLREETMLLAAMTAAEAQKTKNRKGSKSLESFGAVVVVGEENEC